MNGHVIVVDLGYGDAGKGSVVDWLCAAGARAAGERHAAASTVVRFNGGAQAAHHVVAPNGRTHAFAQFGSGTFTPGTRTFLSRFMLVDLLALTAEAEHLAQLGVHDPLGRIDIDRAALLTTPYHRAANQARESARGDGRHGSCGMGIGETASYALAYPEDAPRVGDIENPATLIRKLEQLRDHLAAATETPKAADIPSPADVASVYRAVADRVTLTGDSYLAKILNRGRSPVVFEGAQGVLLDEWRGFHPYTTWSTTTFENAETLLAEAGHPGSATRLGVARTYQTRHGPGPFPTEDPTLRLPEPHNTTGRWQGPFRQGHLDGVCLGYAAAAAGGVDAVAVTHLDTASAHPELKIAHRYPGVARLEPGPYRDLEYQQALTEMLLTARPVYADAGPRNEDDWCSAIADLVHAPVLLRSRGPRHTDKTAPTLVLRVL